MKKSLSGIIALAALTLFLSCLFGSPKSYKLELNLEKGSHYQIVAGIDQLISTSFGGYNMDINSAMKMYYTYDVNDIDSDGNFNITETLNRLTMNVSFGGNEFEFDTDNPPDDLPPSFMLLKKLTGVTVDMKASPAGKILEVNMDKMTERIIEELRESDSLSPDSPIKSFEDYFSSENMARVAERYFAYLPGKPVRVGDSWISEFAIMSGFKLNFNTRYTLVSVKDGIATVDLTAHVDSDTIDSDMTGMAEGTTFSLSGDATGKYLVDQGSGLTNTGKIDMNFVGSMSIASDTGESPMDFPMSMKMDVTTEMKKVY